MANTHNIFIEFNKKIRLSKAKKDSLRTSRNALRDKIKKDFASDADYSPVFKSQGSFPMDTIVEPISKGKYDLDDGVHFDVKEKPKESTSTFHKWIYDAVGDHTDKVTDKNPCVRVIFSDGHNVDLTIYYRIGSNHPFLAHKKNGWSESDPQEFITWFNNKLDEQKQLRRIVRYLKAWCDYKSLAATTGLILTILAAENYSEAERDDIALLNTLKNIQSKLKFSFACYRPTTPSYEDLLKNCSETDKNSFLSALDSFIKSGEQAVTHKNQKDACEKWEKHFGDRFPTSMAEDELDEANKFSSPVILNSDGRSA